MAIAKAPSNADLAPTLARDWALQVDIGTNAEPKWEFVRGLSKFAPTYKAKMQDDADIDSEGYGSQIATAMEMTFDGEGKQKVNSEYKLPAGNQALSKAGRTMGLRNVVRARCWRTDGYDEGYEAHFSVEWEEKAGSYDDLNEFSFTMMSRGKPQRIKPVEGDGTAASVPVEEETGFTNGAEAGTP